MLAKFRSAVSKSRRRHRELDRRRALHRPLRAEALEGRLLLSGDSWVLPTGMSAAISGSSGSEAHTDSLGNVYLATSVYGGAETGDDLFLAKYSPAGVEVWAHRFPVPGTQHVWTATVASDGFYVAGNFSGTMDFDPTAGERILETPVGDGQVYLTKYALTGDCLWAQQFAEWSLPQGLAEQDGDVYVVGNYGGTKDPFSITKISGADGQTCWAKTLGTGVPSALALYRPDGGPTHIYMAGDTYISRKVPSSGFVMELSESADGSDVSILWDRDLGRDFGNPASHIAVREEQDGLHIYVPSMQTGMLLKLDAFGNTVWSQQVIHDDLIHFNDVALEGSTVYLVGSFLGSVNFDQNAADGTVYSRGDRDGFIARYDSTFGALTAVQRVGGGGFDSLVGLAVDDGSLLASGVASPPDADFLASVLNELGETQMSAFVPVLTKERYTMKFAAAAPIVQVEATDINAPLSTPVTLFATASAGNIVWYESGVALVDADPVAPGITLNLPTGVHQISAIATDDAGLIGMAGVVVTVAPPATLAINDVSLAEGRKGTTKFIFTVTRGGDTSGAVTVSYATTDGSATAGSDYNATGGTLSFAAGETSKTIAVGVIGDRTAEANENFFVNLSNAVGGQIVDSQGVGTIVNDDGTPLMAAFDEHGSVAGLSLAQVQRLTPLAVAWWSGQSPVAVPSDLRVEIDDLPSGQLGEAFHHLITLDTDANGVGWSVDSEAPAAGRVDLLTVLTHEIGHVLGYDHSGAADDLMAATLPAGTRRLPGLYSAVGSPLLPKTWSKAMQSHLVDHTMLSNTLSGDPSVNNDLWLLPVLPADDMGGPRISAEVVQARILSTVADEETALLDDELLDLIAAGSK